VNLRVVAAGVLLIALAAGFFGYMTSLAPRSNDPAEMLRVVGMTAGGAAGIGFVMVIVGILRRKRG